MEETVLKRANPGQRLGKLVAENMALLALLVILLVFQILTSGRMLTAQNLNSIFFQSFQLMLGCMAVTFLFALGGLDLTMGNTIGFAALIGARVAGISIWLCLLVCLLVSVSVSLLNGFLYTKAKLPLFIAGLSISFVLGGFLQPLSNNGTIAIPYKYVSWNNSTVKIVVLAVVFLIYGYLFVYTKIGRQMKAIGAGEVAAVQSGVNTGRMKRLAFVLSGIMSGVLAFMTLLRDLGADSDTGSMFEFNVMVALVLGGMPMSGGSKARFRFAIYGALTLSAITNGLTLWGANGNVQNIVKAGIFIMVLAIGTVFERGKDG